LNASTSTGGRPARLAAAAAAAAGAAALLAGAAPARLAAQTLLEQFSAEHLRPSALQADLGPLGGDNIRGTIAGGVRLDYGLVAPRVRVLLGVSYFKADFSAAARRRFEQRLRSVVIDPSGDDTVRLGRIAWSDLTGDLDLQYVLPQGRGVTAYLGVGLGVHVRNGSGAAIRGTFVEDALDEITAGLNGTMGAEFGGKRWRVTLDARGVVSSGLSTASLRAGVMYRWAGAGAGAGTAAGGPR
jgi:hypothetical protein